MGRGWGICTGAADLVSIQSENAGLIWQVAGRDMYYYCKPADTPLDVRTLRWYVGSHQKLMKSEMIWKIIFVAWGMEV